jgi:small-conductance mechanosensitive channel
VSDLFIRLLRIGVAFATVLFATMASAEAQSTSGAAASTTATPFETQEAVRRVVSELDDAQARKLLIERLSKEAAAHAAKLADRDTRSFHQWVTDYGHALGRLYREGLERIARLPEAFSKAAANFQDKRGDRSIWTFWLSLIACLLAGAVAAYMVQRRWPAPDYAAGSSDDATAIAKIKAASVSIILQLMPVAAFALAAIIVNLAANSAFVADRQTTTRVIAASGWAYLLIVFARIALTPTLANWRGCPVAGGASKLLISRLSITAVVFNFGFGLAEWMDWYGSPYAESWFGLWVLFAVHVLLLVTVWQNHYGISALAAGCARSLAARPKSLAARWPYLILAILIAHWFIVTAMIATASVPQGFLKVMGITLIVLAGLPLISHAIRAIVNAALPDDRTDNPSLQAADEMTRRGVTRVANIVLGVVITIGLLNLWGVNLIHLARIGVDAGLAGALINAALILGVAYGAWELVHISVDRQIAAERVALGLDDAPNDSEEVETEGGGAGARLGTILPLVKFAADVGIWVLAVLSILGQLGVNIWPLLAGAGVVGLAIGFGAQKLVRDVISGIFFLIDDAFRKGEYIDIGSVKGTVERISLRSMQLRHHNGPLNTVPFGDIGHVTNFSRDWVVMKFSLRLTYDTDAEKVRKMIKKLGQQLLEDPEYGPKFLQPLKSQGVIEMEDSAMIMRVKFMTRPGDQWGLRRLIFARLRELFEQNNIRFASREVSVRIATERDIADVPERERLAAAAASRTATEQPVPTG